MANEVARLRVYLGLNSAEYTTGLTKAEYQAQQFARNTKKAILEVGKVLGGLEIARVVTEAAKAIVEEAAALNDLADATGSSVESLSKLNNQAKIAGTDFGTMQAALLKLSQGMAGADEESTKTKEALKILGITAKDPAEALQQVAVELNKYQDGVNKVGLAVALFGKQGAGMVATLKDMAELQQIGATVTAKQAEEAEKLQKQIALLSYESQGFAKVILSSVVPALNEMIEEMRTGIRISGGLLSAFRDFALIDLGNVEGEIARVSKELADLERKSGGSGVFTDINGEVVDATKSIAQLRRQLEYLGATKAQQQKRNEALRAAEDRGFDPRAQAPNPPGGGSTAKAIRETTSDAERYIATLQKQVVAQQDLNAVDLAELEIARLQKDAKSGLTAATEEHIRTLARELEAGKERDRVAKEDKKNQEAAAKAREQYAETVRRGVENSNREAEGIHRANEGIKEQIIFLKGGEEALDAYNAAKTEALAVAKEFEAAQLLAAGGAIEEAEAIRGVAAALRETNKLAGDLKIAKAMAKEAKELQDVKDALSDSFARNFEDFVNGTKTAREAFRAFVDDVTRMITRLAAQNIANKLFGGQNSGGPDFFAVMAKLLAGSMGGGSTAIGSGAIQSGGLTGYATGGVSKGGWAVVGEHGPELVHMKAGNRVYSNSDSKKMVGAAGNVTQIFNVPARANTQTIRQQAKQGYRAATGAASRG